MATIFNIHGGEQEVAELAGNGDLFDSQNLDFNFLGPPPWSVLWPSNIFPRPTFRQLTAAMIRMMPAAELLNLFYDLATVTADNKRNPCIMVRPHPLYSAGLPASWETFNHEVDLQKFIYNVRTDLRYVKNEETGEWMPGLVPLWNYAAYLAPVCPPTLGDQIFKWAITVIASLIPGGWPAIIFTIQSLVVSALRVQSDMAAMRARLAIFDTALQGVFGVFAQDNRDRAALYRYFRPDMLPYDCAVHVPVSELSWKYALVLGLPHPAMICRVGETCQQLYARLGQETFDARYTFPSPFDVCTPGTDCPSGTIETMLRIAYDKVLWHYQVDLQAKIDDAILNSWPYYFRFSYDDSDEARALIAPGAKRYSVLRVIPTVDMSQGRPMLIDISGCANWKPPGCYSIASPDTVPGLPDFLARWKKAGRVDPLGVVGTNGCRIPDGMCQGTLIDPSVIPGLSDLLNNWLYARANPDPLKLIPQDIIDRAKSGAAAELARQAAADAAAAANNPPPVVVPLPPDITTSIPPVIVLPDPTTPPASVPDVPGGGGGGGVIISPPTAPSAPPVLSQKQVATESALPNFVLAGVLALLASR